MSCVFWSVLYYFIIIVTRTLCSDIDCDNYWLQINSTCDDNYYAPTIAIQTLSAYTNRLLSYSAVSLSIRGAHDVMITPHCISMDIAINPSIIVHLSHEWLSNRVEWPPSHVQGDIMTFTNRDTSQYITFSDSPCVASPNSTAALILLFNTNFDGYSIDTTRCKHMEESQHTSLSIYDRKTECASSNALQLPFTTDTTRWNLNLLAEDDATNILETQVIYEYISHVEDGSDRLIMSLIIVIIVLNMCCCALLWYFNQKQFHRNIKEIRQNIDNNMYKDREKKTNNNEEDDEEDEDEDEEEEDEDDEDKTMIISIDCCDNNYQNISTMATMDLSSKATNKSDTSSRATHTPSPSDRHHLIDASNIAMYSDETMRNRNYLECGSSPHAAVPVHAGSHAYEDRKYVQNNNKNKSKTKTQIKNKNQNNIVWVNQSYFDSNKSEDQKYNLFKLQINASNRSGSNDDSFGSRSMGSNNTNDDAHSCSPSHSPKVFNHCKPNSKLDKLRIVLPPPKASPHPHDAPWNNAIANVNSNTATTRTHDSSSHHASDTTLSAMTLSGDDFLSPSHHTHTTHQFVMDRINENEATPITKVTKRTRTPQRSSDNESLFSVASSIRLPAYHPNKIKVLSDNKHIPYNKTFIIAVTPPINDRHYEERKGKMLITKENISTPTPALPLPQTNDMQHLYRHTHMLQR